MKKSKSVILAMSAAAVITVFATGWELDRGSYQTALAAEVPSFEGTVGEIKEYGNIVLGGFGSEDLLEAGYEYGDVVVVTIGDVVNEMPFCSNYSDVDADSLVLRDNTDKGNLVVAINLGDYASTYGIAQKEVDDDNNVTWYLEDGSSVTDLPVSVELKEKGAYLDQIIIHQLERTNEREDYESDEVFANFRAVTAGSMGQNALYRSSSPVDNQYNRAAYADQFISQYGIRTVLNLANAGQAVEEFFAEEDFASPCYEELYNSGQVICLNLSMDFKSDDFKAGLAEGLRFLIENDGPYLIHCTEGKDRTGFVAVVLEALMGAGYEELVDDYMLTYENYYHVEPGTEKYEVIIESNIISVLEYLTEESEVSALSGEQYAAYAEQYLLGCGMTEEEIETLKDRLSRDYDNTDE